MFLLLLTEVPKDELSIYNTYIQPLVQPLITTVFIALLGYIVQRRYKYLDTYKIEKNKSILTKTIESESEIFDILKIVVINYSITSSDLINYSQKITQLRMDNYLYISDKIYSISGKISDYLLEVSQDSSKRTKFGEEQWMKEFKREFRK